MLSCTRINIDHGFKPLWLGAAALALTSAGIAPAVLAEEAAGTPMSFNEQLVKMLSEHNALSAEQAEILLNRLRAEGGAAAATPAAAPSPTDPDGTIRVPYLSETQKKKIRDEVTREVLATTKAQNWAQPNGYPDWLNRITIGGDLRFRFESNLFDGSNSPQFIDYQTINSGNPFDVNFTNGQLPALLNTREDREVARVRGRLDLGAKVADDLSAAFRLTTGNSTNPVSTNQILGNDFNKFSFVVDLAYFDYRPSPGVDVWLGRLPNPWFTPTSLQWDEDLNFDGLAARYQFQDRYLGMLPFATIGAFTVQNTAFDFPSNSLDKVASRDKWLFGAQFGFDAQFQSGLTIKEAISFQYYYHLEGATSSPCEAITANTPCDTDNTRPSFLQQGNTLFALRDLFTTADNLNAAQFQYFGLASPFRIIDVSLQADQPIGGPLHAIFSAETVLNLGYNSDAVAARVPVNGYDANNNYRGGRRGGQVQVMVGYPALRERGEWNLLGGYRRVESDAVVDAFTDSVFHLGGTNNKGFYLSGGLGFTHSAWVTLRWLSATEVHGPPLAVDVIQLDVNARF